MRRSTSVTEDGTEDGWEPKPGYYPERTPNGETRIVASVPPSHLQSTHLALVRACAPPLNFLYRQRLDRTAIAEGAPPPPSNAPTADFIALHLEADPVEAAIRKFSRLLHLDARSEVWIRGKLGEQVVLDADGILYVYPDDPSFRDALDAIGLPQGDVETMAERDYVKHWFHAENDSLETELLASLRLTPIPHR